jgi:hypothetical protein
MLLLYVAPTTLPPTRMPEPTSTAPTTVMETKRPTVITKGGISTPSKKFTGRDHVYILSLLYCGKFIPQVDCLLQILILVSDHIIFTFKVFYAKIVANIVKTGQTMEDVTQIAGCLTTVY